MKYSTPAILLAAALGASAHPSGHAHMHRSLHARGGDFVKAVKPAPPAPEPTTTEAAQPSLGAQFIEKEPETSKTPKPSPSPESDKDDDKDASKPSGGSGLGHDTYTEFCGGNSQKRATIAEIHYKGNTGEGGDFGCNMMLVKSDIAEEYKYLSTIENVSDDDHECVCYNKIGPDGGVNGFFNGNEALRFNVPAHASQAVVADENTQGGCVCDVKKVPLTNWGQFASTWLEFDFGNTSNDGWSGADASCLVSAALGLPIPGLEVCGHGTCSTIFPGGDGINAFLAGMEELDGLGLNIPPGKARLHTKVGFTG